MIQRGNIWSLAAANCPRHFVVSRALSAYCVNTGTDTVAAYVCRKMEGNGDEQMFNL